MSKCIVWRSAKKKKVTNYSLYLEKANITKISTLSCVWWGQFCFPYIARNLNSSWAQSVWRSSFLSGKPNRGNSLLQWVCLQNRTCIFLFFWKFGILLSEMPALVSKVLLSWCFMWWCLHSGHFAKHRPNRNCHINWGPGLLNCAVVSVLQVSTECLKGTSLWGAPQCSCSHFSCHQDFSHEQRLMFSMKLQVSWCFQK